MRGTPTLRKGIYHLYLGLRSDSMAAFHHHRQELWSKVPTKNPLLSPDLGPAFVHRIKPSFENLELITTALVRIAASQCPIELEFSDTFVFPNPARDIVCAREWPRSLHYELDSPESMILYETILKELSNVTVLCHAAIHLKKHKSPPLPRWHHIRENPNAFRKHHLYMPIINAVDKEIAIVLQQEHQAFDARKKFGVLIGDSFKLVRDGARFGDGYEPPRIILSIPFLRAK